jgi:hypothetical protein
MEVIWELNENLNTTFTALFKDPVNAEKAYNLAVQKGYKKEWSKNQYKTNIQFKLSQLLRIRLIDALKGKINKFESTLELLGCSIEELKLYLEQQFKPDMTWENHGILWEIDHIKPCAIFDLTDSKSLSNPFSWILFYLNTIDLVFCLSLLC